ncbi:MAG: cell division protein [Chromatiales bacterium]|nr:cell division protein [Chromatiales bacterium]
MLLRSFTLRSRWAAFVLFFLAAVLVTRAVWLQAYENEFLTHQADARQVRIAKIPAHRGVITDRNGEPLAVSTPVDSIWVNPGKIVLAPEYIPQLAAALGNDPEELARRLTRNITREFMYLKRHMRPDDALAIVGLNIPGVDVEREYQRYYPAGEVIGHVIGFTNIDDVGQEGLELAFDHWLAGRPGKKRVLKDRLGRVVEEVELIQSPNPGRELATSIDLRIQYLAYRELKAVIQRSEAASGSVVVLDVGTGEVLAMVNQPTYNPNDRAQFSPIKYRNRAITDIFEPGSTIKPLVIAAALESGQYHTASLINTSPGFIKVGAKVIKDERNLGMIDLKTLLARSSNVGASKVAMSLPTETLYNVLSGFGLGRLSGSGFPGESAGLLSHYSNWLSIRLATLGYGYGLSVTPLQLAQAYSVIAAGGLQHPVSLLRLEQAPIARQVISGQTAGAVLSMLEAVVSEGGTGQQANVAGYRVAGKTGTVKKSVPGGYAEDHHMALFSGIAPATRPRLAVVVLIDEPSNGKYYGGAVAAPVFSRIVEGSLRILAIPPDNFMRPVGTTKLAVSRP